MTTILRTAVFLLLAQVSAPMAQPAATVRGLVRSSDGRPVSSATVEIRRTDGTTPQSYSTNSAGDGTFQLGNIRPGEYRVIASAAGFLRTEYGQRRATDNGVVVSLAPNQVLEDIQITMGMPGVIAGRVVDSDGDPVGNAEVRALTRTYQDGQRILKLV